MGTDSSARARSLKQRLEIVLTSRVEDKILKMDKRENMRSASFIYSILLRMPDMKTAETVIKRKTKLSQNVLFAIRRKKDDWRVTDKV